MTKKYQQKITDEELMRDFIKTRDLEIFAQIYDRYFTHLSKYICWLIRDVEKAKDLTQNILIKVFKSPELCDPSNNFKVWLFSIANNQCKNTLRNEAIQKEHLTFLSKETPVSNIERNERQNEGRLFRIHKAINQLSENHKEVIILKYSNNLTIAEIGQVLNCSEGTIKSRLYYALNNLRNNIKPQI